MKKWSLGDNFMIGFSNLNSLISLCGAKNRFASMSFAQQDSGMVSYTAADLAKSVKAIKISGDKNAEIKMLISDSRRVVPHTAFFAIKGLHCNGNDFVEEAAHRGAVAIVSEEEAPKVFPATWIQVENVEEAAANAAKNFYGNEDGFLELFAVTGTNGKTSVSWMVQDMLNKLGTKCGLVGTIHYDLGGRCLPASRTTPEALELHAMFNQMRYANCKATAIEMSSHAIEQKRVKGIAIDCACFLNLTQDHLDYHKTMESYFEVKASLFTGVLGKSPKNAVVNFDDPHGREIAKRLSPETKLVSFSTTADDAYIRATDIKMYPQKSTFALIYPEGKVDVSINMTGQYNISNALAALAMIYASGRDIEKAAEILSNFKGVPGRMEKVQSPAKFDIFIDYAHTDDALKNGLSMLRKVVKGKLLVVFGCGGKRDKTKRPLMTKVVQEYADIAWATSDNPRGESVESIFADMKEGVIDPSRIAFVEDRRRAINLAIDAAADGDCILIAGKGHETFQELGDTIIPFDDKRVAEELLNLKGLL